MQYRPLGTTDIGVSAVSFGAGPISGLMVGDDRALQRATVARAIERGINWFDTAATYGEGRSEASLGAALAELEAQERVHLATKVRLMPDQLGDIGRAVQESIALSLARLRLERVTLLQLHNSITVNRGDLHTSITPRDVLDKGGVLEAFERLRRDGMVGHLGLTGIGHPAALREVVASRAFASIQAEYSVLNPSAGRDVPESFPETNYQNLFRDCAAAGMGIIAIRAFAGGALAGQIASVHTQKTKFFPLDLYVRDQRRALRLGERLPPGMGLKELAVRFVLSHPHVSTALIGLGSPEQVDEAVSFAAAGPLAPEILDDCAAAAVTTFNV